MFTKKDKVWIGRMMIAMRDVMLECDRISDIDVILDKDALNKTLSDVMRIPDSDATEETDYYLKEESQT